MTQAFTEEDVQRYAEHLRDHYRFPEANARDFLQALAEDGRLLPPGVEMIDEWSVRYVVGGVQTKTSRPFPTRAYAEEWLRRIETHPNCSEPTVVRRRVIEYVGPWSVVEQPQEHTEESTDG